MRQSRILYFLISSCIAVVLASCASKTVKGFEEKAVADTAFKATYFSDKATDYVYKAHISIYGKDFGGIFIAKKMNDTLSRVAFTTEFGNKLFDFEITDDSFKVNYILEELDRKIIVNMLKRDFMLLLKQNYIIQQQYEDAANTVYKSKAGNRYNYLFLDKASGKLTKLVNAKVNEKIIITYLQESDILAHKIIIDHKNINLRIELDYIK